MTDTLPTALGTQLVTWTGLTTRSVHAADSHLVDTQAIDISAIIAADRLDG